MSDQQPVWRITVTDRKFIKDGVGESGKHWTLYEIQANDEEGQPMEDQLRSFQALPVGRQIEVEAERRESEKYGVSYTLRGNFETGDAARIAELEARMAVVENALESIGSAQLGSK